MTKALFIGSFLSRHRGSKSIAETLSENLLQEGIDIKLTSQFENKFLRLADIVWTVFRFSGKRINIDVYSNQAFIIAMVASGVAQWKKKEIMLTLHGGKLQEFAQSNAKRIDKLFKRAAYIQTPSLFLKAYFIQKGYAINYLPNFLDLSKFPYKREVKNPYSLLWVRSFISIYNPELPIKILAEVRKKYPQCTLTMVGPDNGLLSDTVKLVKELDIEAFVTFTGPVPNEELFRYYQSHRVYLNTTSYESFGVAVVEAASCGIPIISTNVGEIPYLWEHNENIILTKGLGVDDFVEGVLRIFEEEGLEQKLSEAARKKAESFSWEEIKHQWIKLLS